MYTNNSELENGLGDKPVETITAASLKQNADGSLDEYYSELDRLKAELQQHELAVARTRLNIKGLEKKWKPRLKLAGKLVRSSDKIIEIVRYRGKIPRSELNSILVEYLSESAANINSRIYSLLDIKRLLIDEENNITINLNYSPKEKNTDTTENIKRILREY